MHVTSFVLACLIVFVSLFILIQAKIGSLEIQLNEALSSSNTRLNVVPETVSGALPNSRTTGDVMDSSTVTNKLEEELKKRDALIEVVKYIFFILSLSFIFT